MLMIIKRVEMKENSVKIILDNKDSFSISVDAYLENSILIGNDINEDEIKELLKKSNSSLVKIELLNKLSRKKLSKRECFSFLKERNLTDNEIKNIICEFTKNYLINDKELTEFIIDYSLMRKKGIEKIMQNIKDRGLYVEESYIREYMDYDIYKENIIYLLDKYKKMGKNKSNKALKLFLTQKMIENGYRQDEFSYFIEDKNNDENEIITKEITKLLKNKEIDEEIISKITKKLLSKGFNYAIIKETIRSVVENETY